MSEAMLQPFVVTDARQPPPIEILKALSGSLDTIEHLAGDLLNEAARRSDAKSLANLLLKEAESLRCTLFVFSQAIGTQLTPSMGDLDLLCSAGKAHGGELSNADLPIWVQKVRSQIGGHAKHA